MLPTEQTESSELELFHLQLVRGHHIYRFVELWGNISSINTNPDLIKQLLIRGKIPSDNQVLKISNDTCTEFIRKLQQSTDTKYIQDVIGNTDESRAFFANQLTQQFQSFLFSQSNETVMVTTNKDGICQGCADGAHCHVLQHFDKIMVKRVGQFVGNIPQVLPGGHLEVNIPLSKFREMVCNLYTQPDFLKEHLS